MALFDPTKPPIEEKEEFSLRLVLPDGNTLLGEIDSGRPILYNEEEPTVKFKLKTCVFCKVYDIPEPEFDFSAIRYKEI